MSLAIPAIPSISSLGSTLPSLTPTTGVGAEASGFSSAVSDALGSLQSATSSTATQVANPAAVDPAAATTTSAPAAPAPGTDASGGDAFSNAVGNAVDALQQTQATASTAEAQAAAGQGNIADTMIAASEASLDTEVTTSLLNQATSAYNDIMNLSF